MLWFGVIESGITARYLLLPVTFMLCALAVDLTAMLGVDGGSAARRWCAALVALAASSSRWRPGAACRRGPRAPRRRGRHWSSRRLRAELQPDDLVAGGDELATLSVAGRVDAWLALDEFFRERFVVMRGARPTGTYTGAPAAFELAPAARTGQRAKAAASSSSTC